MDGQLDNQAILNHDERIQLIESYIDSGRLAELREQVNSYHPADVADILEDLPAEVALIVFDLLADEVASEVLDETGSLIRAELVEKVDDERLADLLDVLPMDDAAEFLDELPEETAERLMGLMEPEEVKDVQELLAYQDETAGRLMTRDVATLQPDWTVAEAIHYLRSLVEQDEAETIHYLYAVDHEHRLVGVVPVRALLLATAGTHIADLMVRDVITIPVNADQEELAEMISKYDFVAMPIVDVDQRLLGVVTVDDVLDIVAEEVTEDIQRLGGSEPLAQPYFTASLTRVVSRRLIWLLPLFIASLATDMVVRNFTALLALYATVGIFIPMLSGTAGNAGSQTVSTIIRALAVGDVRTSDLGRAWLREVSVGLILGLVLGLAGLIRGLIMGAEPGVPIVLALTLPLVVAWSTTVATVVPITAERLHIDPAVVSAPMITTIVDATGILIYLLLAQTLLAGIS